MGLIHPGFLVSNIKLIILNYLQVALYCRVVNNCIIKLLLKVGFNLDDVAE